MNAQVHAPRRDAGTAGAAAGAYIHATALAIGEAGILIRGRSGAGKSRLALDLIMQARSRGAYADLVGDDRVNVSCHGHRLLARPHPAIAGQIESRGDGILNMSFEAGIVLRLIVDIDPEGAETIRLPDGAAQSVTVCGVDLPLLVVPSSALQHTDRILDRLWRMRNA